MRLKLNLGNIAVWQTVTVTFDVIVKSDAAGQARLYNTAKATGDNGSASGTDNGFLVDEDSSVSPFSDIYTQLFYGYEDGTFRPGNYLTRAEGTALLCNTLVEFPSYTATSSASATFSDVNPSLYYYKAVDYLLTKGYIAVDTTFRPDDNITREEFGIIAARVGQLASYGYTGNSTTFTDSPHREEVMAFEAGWIYAATAGARLIKTVT